MIWITKNLKREGILLRRVVSEAAGGSQIISAGLPQPVLPRLPCPTPNQDPYPPLFNGILLVLAHHLLWLRPSGSFWSECLIPTGSYLGSTIGEAFWVSKGPEVWELFSRLHSACCPWVLPLKCIKGATPKCYCLSGDQVSIPFHTRQIVQLSGESL